MVVFIRQLLHWAELIFFFQVSPFFLFQGKGSLFTYFLNGRDGFTKSLPDLSKAASLEEHDFK